VKDNITLIAAAAGGFMLSVALTGILRGAPVTSLSTATHMGSSSVTYITVAKTDSGEEFTLKKNY
jgi:hypothetical protein